ncbi:MAG: hypothetical protein JWP96_1412 [Polaromonas sp.]|nr:hypothetical protein [Polaromonas sp.]
MRIALKVFIPFSYSHIFVKLTRGPVKNGDIALMTPQKSNTSVSNTPAQPAAGKGMPAKEPQPQKPLTDRQPDFNDGSVEDTLELPRDRDEATDMTGGHKSPLIEQAAQDVENGLKDTSKAAEMDRTYEKFRKSGGPA